MASVAILPVLDPLITIEGYVPEKPFSLGTHYYRPRGMSSEHCTGLQMREGEGEGEGHVREAEVVVEEGSL